MQAEDMRQTHLQDFNKTCLQHGLSAKTTQQTTHITITPYGSTQEIQQKRSRTRT